MITKFDIPTIFFGFIVIVLTVLKAFKIQKKSKEIKLIGIWLWGLIAFISSGISFLLSMLIKWDEYQGMKNVNSSLISEGIVFSIRRIIIGFFILFISIIFWVILKRKNEKLEIDNFINI